MAGKASREEDHAGRETDLKVAASGSVENLRLLRTGEVLVWYCQEINELRVRLRAHDHSVDFASN